MSGEPSVQGSARLERREGDRLRRDPAFLSAVLDGSGFLIVVLDGKGRVVLFNRACEALSGWSGDAMRGRRLGDALLPPGEAEAWEEAFDPLRPARVREQQELSWRTRSGEVRRIAWRNRVLCDAEGVPRHVVCTGMDLTELRSLERRAAEVAERERERFGQDLHDGLGQDLTAVALACGVLRAKLGEGLPELGREAEAIEGLVRKALVKSRALARGLYPAALDARELPSRLRDLARSVGETFGVSCDFAWDEAAEIPSEAVARNVYWIVQEAVTNAVRHGAPRTIRVSAQRGKDGTRIRVRDDGKGLKADPDPQGMGLRVMKSRARTIGAELRIADDPGGGVLVECVLPSLSEEAP